MSEFPKFRSRLAFVFVTAGAAVGLGNVWGFTYVAHKHAGGLFLLIYGLALAGIAVPALMSELVLGRLGGSSPPVALARLRQAAGSCWPWPFLAWVGLVGSLLVLSFYMVIAGEVLAFGAEAIFSGIAGWNKAEPGRLDALYRGSMWPGALWGGIFVTLTVLIVSFDIRAGLERAGNIMMPALLVLMVVLAVYAVHLGDMAAVGRIFLNIRWQDLSIDLVLDAVGQAFFTLSVGLCGVMLLGAYMAENVNLARASILVAVMDLAVALLAGLIIFPIALGAEARIAAGPGLVFVTLPTLFAELPFGRLAAVLFFVALGFAALTSAIALLATPVSWLVERGVSRPLASIGLGLVAYLLSGLTIVSFNHMAGFAPLGFLGLADRTFFDLIREGVTNIILPLAGLAISFMVGWGIDQQRLQDALGMAHPGLFNVWRVLVRYLVPAALLVVFAAALLGNA